MQVLAARFETYGLKLHPEKTRLLDFRKPAEGQRKGKESFTFLGFRQLNITKNGRRIPREKAPICSRARD
jgi:hypothetical protein